jgi:uncharacterized protein (UPF0216 family)
MDVEHLFSDLNVHAPVTRRSLIEIIDSGDRTFRTRGGHVCEISQEEIGRLCEVCTEQEKLLLKLPFTVMTDTSYAEGVWKVEGRTEVSVVSKLLSKKPLRENLIHLYHPHLRELTKILPNCVTVLFIPHT